MTAERKLPARKFVTAWSIEPLEENGDDFYVLTFHHGLGEMTRLDLDAGEVRSVIATLTAGLDDNGDTPRDERTVWRITAADLDENVKRQLTDDELARFAANFDNSTVNECVEGLLEQIIPDLYPDDDDVSQNQNYTPHPDYPAEVWTAPQVETETKAFIDGAAADAAVLADGIMEVLKRHGYDSIDRELAFWYASQTKGVDYEALYQRWMNS